MTVAGRNTHKHDHSENKTNSMHYVLFMNAYGYRFGWVGRVKSEHNGVFCMHRHRRIVYRHCIEEVGRQERERRVAWMRVWVAAFYFFLVVMKYRSFVSRACCVQCISHVYMSVCVCARVCGLT